ncbi:unnamed protein product [Clavelina lepadiformis]|uniref:Uncharacterized protein n=1 Tax=Clavelina lepadiformis TaxID=159417 RepID=A0ABP0G029_CLALP
MPHLRFTMTVSDLSRNCAYAASVTPGFEEEILEPVLEVLRSEYDRINPFRIESINSKCSSYQFDDPVRRENRGRSAPVLLLSPVSSTDSLHIALVDEMEKTGWDWLGPNERYHKSETQENVTTWTFKRCS